MREDTQHPLSDDNTTEKAACNRTQSQTLIDSRSVSGDHAYNSSREDIMPKHVSAAAISKNAALVKKPSFKANGAQAVFWYLLSFVVLGLDQWSKWLAESHLTFHDPVPVIEPVLSWTLAYNYGAAFSFLADQNGWQKWFFAGLAFVMALFLLIYLTKTPRGARLLNTGLALVLGGAVGNLIDRLLHGHVIDFIHVHYADVWHYPIFNIADMGICIGVALIVIDMLFLEDNRATR